MNRISKRAWFALALAIVLALGMVFFAVRYCLKSGSWATFSGSPHVYSGGNLNTGVVTDRTGTVLLDATDGRNYADSQLLRMATMHILGDRAGYIPSRLMEKYSDDLIGYNLFTGTYGAGQGKGRMTLTLSAQVQTAVLAALNGQKGTVGVYNYKTGEILCAVTSPTYDPDNVPQIDESDSAYDGVYVNRFFNATYIPGSIFKLVTAAAAIEQIPDIESQTFHCDGSYETGGEVITCNGAHGDLSFEQALAHSCNCAFGQIAEQLETDTLELYAKRIGVADSIEFDGIGTASGHMDLRKASEADLAWAGIGQYTDLINACQFMTYMGAIAGGGKAAKPYLVQKAGSGLTAHKGSTQVMDRVIEKETADKLAEMMRNNVVSIYGTGNFPDLYVCAKSGTAEVGGGQAPNATFAGFIQSNEYPLAFIVIVENGGSGSAVAGPIAGQVLRACVAAMDEES